MSILIVGGGDVARRTLPWLRGRYRLFVVLREAAHAAFWRAQGALPLFADLDDPRSLRRLAGLADIVLHFAPPPRQGAADVRTRRLVAALRRARRVPGRLVYVSTSGVYGDCAGARIDETRPARPTTARARRRVDAERQLRRFGRTTGAAVSILRAPGIYAADRLPLERLRGGAPVLRREEDVFTNHIHADDLAQLACAAIRRGRPNRCYNACDDSELRMGDYFDRVADTFSLPRPPRIARAEAESTLSAMQLSFMSESRRLDNRRIRRELRVRLRYPDVAAGIAAARAEPGSREKEGERTETERRRTWRA